MGITKRRYQVESDRFSSDYAKLRAFLIRLEEANYLFGRWDWMITHSMLDPDTLPMIGLWEEDGELIAIATCDCKLGAAYLLCLPAYRHLLREMLIYAEAHLRDKDGKFRVLIRDGHDELQGIAASMGYAATQKNERDAVYQIDGPIVYALPDGFRVVSMAEEYDYRKYKIELWKGFNHEANGEGVFSLTDEQLERDELEMLRPNVNLHLKIAVVAPNGDFVSYCGMWYDPAASMALVEPVATDPAYRRMGLGRAVVLEGVKRCGQLGAKRAFVGSSQQFYYSIGFRPYQTSTFWERANRE